MANALDAVLQLRSQEQQRQQQAESMALQQQQFLQQVKQQEISNKLQQLQLDQSQREAPLKELLLRAQIGNLQADALKNAQAYDIQKQQNDILNRTLNGNSNSQNGLRVKSVKVGDVTLESPSDSPIASIDMSKLPNISNGNTDEFISSLPPEVATNVKSAANYELDPNKIYGLRNNSGDRAKFDALVKTINPNWDSKEYERRNTFLKKWDSSPQYSQTQQSLDLVANHLSSLNDSLARLDNGNVLLLNAGNNEIQRQTGKKEIQRALVDAQAVSTEFTKALRGGGVINQAEEESWNKKINASLSPEQAKETIAGMVDLIAPRFASQLNKYKATMGSLPKGVFTPEAIDSIKRLSGKKLPSVLQEYINNNKSSDTYTSNNNELQTPSGIKFTYKLKGN